MEESRGGEKTGGLRRKKSQESLVLLRSINSIGGMHHLPITIEQSKAKQSENTSSLWGLFFRLFFLYQYFLSFVFFVFGSVESVEHDAFLVQL